MYTDKMQYQNALQLCLYVFSASGYGRCSVDEYRGCSSALFPDHDTKFESDQFTKITDAPNIIPTPPALVPYPVSAVSEACKCLGIPASDFSTRTATTTATTTTTLCPIPTTCGNEGVQWAYYQDSRIPFNSITCSGAYTWTVEEIKEMTPSYNSATTYLFLESTDSTDISIYGSTGTF